MVIHVRTTAVDNGFSEASAVKNVAGRFKKRTSGIDRNVQEGLFAGRYIPGKSGKILLKGGYPALWELHQPYNVTWVSNNKNLTGYLN